MRHRDIINVMDPAQPFYDEVMASSRETVDAYLARRDYKGASHFQREMIDLLEEIAPADIGKDWRKAIRTQFKNPRGATQWKARALNLDGEDPHMSIALASFAPMKVGQDWFLAIPLPIPRPMGPKFAEPKDIVLIHPQTGEARLYSDDDAHIVEPIYTDRFTVHADARVWAREIAAQAIEWFYRCQSAYREANVAPIWNGHAPAALAIGNVAKILWPHITSITAGAGIDAAQLKKVIFRQARITHVESPLNMVRAA